VAETVSRQEIIRQLSIGADLAEEFTTCPAYFARYAFLHARAMDAVRKAEDTLELLFSELYAEYREEHDDAKENDCKAYIRSDTGYREAQRELRRAKRQSDTFKAAVRAFELKRDMLMQLGADRRNDLVGTDIDVQRHKASKVVQRALERRGR